MSAIRVTVCRSCPAGQGGLAQKLRAAVAAAGLAAEIGETDCMSGCARPSTVAFRAAGKTAYLFGDICEADIANLVTFLKLYATAPDGDLTDARRLGTLRQKAIARIPGREVAIDPCQGVNPP